MVTVTVLPKFQVVIPKKVRETQVLMYQNRIELIPLRPLKAQKGFLKRIATTLVKGINVVDSSAWLAYFADDCSVDIFAKPIEVIDRLRT